MQPALRLPTRLADFRRRGFRTDRPHSRAALEKAAVTFLRGYNRAARARTLDELHDRLDDVEPEYRGFAYEGAAMHLAVADLARAGRTRYTEALSTGRGDGYTYLVNVGAGWPLAWTRRPRVPRLPETPLVRWLAVDGAGFGAAFFGGERALQRICRATHSSVWRTRVAGAGRALWFQQAADIEGVCRVIGQQPAPARPDLWAGIGLACTYAGATDAAGLTELRAATGPHLAWLQQGVVFGAAARARAGVTPSHTHDACQNLAGLDVDQAATWAAEESSDLLQRRDIGAYDEWRQRLARRVSEPRSELHLTPDGGSRST